LKFECIDVPGKRIRLKIDKWVTGKNQGIIRKVTNQNAAWARSGPIADSLGDQQVLMRLLDRQTQVR